VTVNLAVYGVSCCLCRAIGLIRSGVNWKSFPFCLASSTYLF